MAEGTASPSFYLSSLDPGVGKTTALIHFVRTLMRSHQHKGVAVLLCFFRLEEITQLVEEMGLNEADFAVFTGKDNEINGLSSTPPSEARILFTTQSMVKSRCRVCSFGDAEVFHYQGEARAVRIWDEAALPGDIVSLSTDDLAALRGPLRQAHPALASVVEQLDLAFNEADMSVPFRFPDVKAVSGVSRWDAQKGQNQTYKDKLWSLYRLSGQLVLLRKRDNRSSVITALDTRDALPADLAPMVIMDASGRLRTTYELWEEQGNLIRLKEALRYYSKLTIHIMDMGGSQSSWNANGEELAKEVASKIDSKPNKPWLAVYPKGARGGTIPDLIKGLVNTDASLISFLSWGQHQGTNDYRDIANVIIAGTMFYTDADYEMLVRSCSGIPNDQKAPEYLIQQMKDGEHMHHILQAICRSSVRSGVGASCGPCDAYIIASKASGIRNLLSTIFPGCKIESWEQTTKKLSGKVGEAVGYVEAFFEAEPDGVFLLCDLQGKLEIENTPNFNRTIRRHVSFQPALVRLGVEEIISGKGRGNNALTKIATFGPDPSATYVADV